MKDENKLGGRDCLITFKVTFFRHKDKVKLTVWKDARTNVEAVDLAKQDKEVLFFFAQADDLYDISVLNSNALELSKLTIIKQSQTN